MLVVPGLAHLTCTLCARLFQMDCRVVSHAPFTHIKGYVPCKHHRSLAHVGVPGQLTWHLHGWGTALFAQSFCTSTTVGAATQLATRCRTGRPKQDSTVTRRSWLDVSQLIVCRLASWLMRQDPHSLAKLRVPTAHVLRLVASRWQRHAA